MSMNRDARGSLGPLTNSDARNSPATPRLVNLPNGLTVLRLFLVPVFVAFLVAGGTVSRVVAFFVFGVASVTDLLDGQLARRSGMITDFGKIADPIADKALTGSALITLSVLGDLPWWVTIVILVREVGVTLLRFWVIRHGVIAASRGGKIKTVLQIIAIGLYILPVSIDWLRSAAMAAAVAVTLVTGVDYTARALRLRRGTQHHPAGAQEAAPPRPAQPAETLPAETEPAESRPADRRPAPGRPPAGRPPGGQLPEAPPAGRAAAGPASGTGQ
jgi:CDP-diacylglycerol---glycerol-3-phosphate 3-phosphatidyltransferase